MCFKKFLYFSKEQRYTFFHTFNYFFSSYHFFNISSPNITTALPLHAPSPYLLRLFTGCSPVV